MANQIKAKLRSQSGASMLIAMLFLAFCVFIGGTVLVSATANNRRVEQLGAQQDQLIGRSTAMLLADEMEMEPGESLRIKVRDVLRTVYDLNVSGGVYTVVDDRSVLEREVTFTVSSRITTEDGFKPLHRLQLESAILRYLKEHPTPGIEGISEEISIVGFPDDYGTVTKAAHFWMTDTPGVNDVRGSLKASAETEAEGLSIPDFEVEFSCGRGDDIYDFFLAMEEPASVRLRVRAYDNTVTMTGLDVTELPAPPLLFRDLPVGSIEAGNDHYWDDHDFEGNAIYIVTHVQDNVAIGWEKPVAEKGGAE